jgi:ABC-type antimicrobial peptide transport system permease subunit
VVGSSVGLVTIVGVAAARSWTPVLDPVVPLAGPVLGGVVGLLAGLYPALRAAALEPVDALRTGL